MQTFETVILVEEDGTVTLRVPPEILPGPHQVSLTFHSDSPEHMAPAERQRFEIPVHDVDPWPKGLSLRREDMYDEWGR